MAKKIPRTDPADRRRDKTGGYARTRRWEKALDRRGLEDREVVVGWLASKMKFSGKWGFNIFRDIIMRKRPDASGKRTSRKSQKQADRRDL